jgi:hypothetical protein
MFLRNWTFVRACKVEEIDIKNNSYGHYYAAVIKMTKRVLRVNVPVVVAAVGLPKS